jgi:hypothetical protein
MNQYEDLLIDLLLDYGFTLDEATRLIYLRERIERERRRQRIRRENVQPMDVEHPWQWN